MVPKESEGNSLAEKTLKDFQKQKFHPGPMPALEQLIFALMTESGLEETEADKAIGAFQEEFVNWNEVRVSRRNEIADVLLPYEKSEELATSIRDMLLRLFELRGAMDLSFINSMKPSEARKHLNDIAKSVSREVVSRILFELCPGTTITISDEALALAKELGLITKNGDKKQLQKVLNTDLSMDDASQLLQYLELASHQKDKKSTKKPSAKKPVENAPEKKKPAKKKVAKTKKKK